LKSRYAGYLEESGTSPLRRMVEDHLVSCAGCRFTFDRVVATHQRVNACSPSCLCTRKTARTTERSMLAVLWSVCWPYRSAEFEAAALPTPFGAAAGARAWRSPVCLAVRGYSGSDPAGELPPLEITRSRSRLRASGDCMRRTASRYMSVVIHAVVFALLMLPLRTKQFSRRLRKGST